MVRRSSNYLVTFEAFISEVINQFLNNIDNEGFFSFTVPTHESFEDLKYIHNSYKDGLVSVYWGSPPPLELRNARLIESEYKAELDDLSLLFYRIREYLHDQNVNTLPITDELVNFLGPDPAKTYTIEYMKGVLQALDIDNEFLLGWVSDQKAFYKVLLDQIRQASTNPNIDQELRASFEQIVDRIGIEGFTENRRFTDNDELLLRKLDEALNNLFGYVGYVLLQLGLIKFDDANTNLKFGLPENLDILKERINKFGIHGIAELSPTWNDDVITEHFLYSILFSGHYKEIMMDDIGQGNRKIHAYPGSQFFTGIFKNFMGNIPDSIYHLSIINALCYSYSMTERFKILNKIPKSWTIFKSEYNLEFYERLVEFRGNDRDLDYDQKLGGGEGKIFKSDNYENKILKRWFAKSFWKFERSVTYLEETRNRIETNPELNQYIEVVEIYDQGNDWILRDFYPFSYELRNALKSEEEARIVYDRVIALLSDTTDFYLTKV